MKLNEVANHQAGPIGITVYHPGDPGYMDFQVFAWPDHGNTISDQSRYLSSKFDTTNDNQHVKFYELLKSQSEGRRVEDAEVYGPFNHISDLI